MATPKKFKHWDIKLPSPAWESDLARKIIELEKLREVVINPESVDLFMELKIVFQQLENWASARIEGNQTRLIDALSPNRGREIEKTVGKRELANLEDAITFIDEYCGKHKRISRPFLLEVHKRVVRNLPIGDEEPGDETPGKFRTKNVEISKSQHMPPPGVKVDEYMEELLNFANEQHSKQFFLLKVAIFHHRFTWVHPFTNGNGRVVRLMTYAMLQLMGYGVQHGRILNPSVVFYANRQRYYDHLGKADSGEEAAILEWADYFIGGLIEEINKIDRLLDKQYMTSKLLIPVLKEARETDRIGEQEYLILRYSLNIEGLTFVSSDINEALGRQLSSLERSRLIRRMRDANIITPAFGAKQRYVIELWSPVFMRYVTKILQDEGFVTEQDGPRA